MADTENVTIRRHTSEDGTIIVDATQSLRFTDEDGNDRVWVTHVVSWTDADGEEFVTITHELLDATVME